MSSGKIFLGPIEFVMGCVDEEGLPQPKYNELAFAGRSNVGKSTLINALTGRKTLARASNTPGRTKEVNFFLLGNSLMMVDLPGYGYAKAPGKQVGGWNKLIRAYLKGRVNLRRVCLLIDSRHGIKDGDVEIMKLLDVAAVPYQIVLTKTDKIKASELTEVIENTQTKIKKHPAAHPRIIATSSEVKDGIEALRNELSQFAKG